jgi:hypothetical protein
LKARDRQIEAFYYLVVISMRAADDEAKLTVTQILK